MKSIFNPTILANTNDNLILILIIIGGVLLLTAAIVLTIVFTNKKKAQKFDHNVWLSALGEKENIKELTAIGSRLTVNLVDKEKIDREKLKELGVSSVLVMSNKVILVIEGKAEAVCEAIQKAL